MSNQKTIAKELVVKGIRQSDGHDTFIKFIPSDSGVYVKYGKKIEPVGPYLMNKKEKRFTNSIMIGNKVITMVEHVFSAVNGLGIDNIIVEFGSDEAPFFADSEVFARVLSENILDIKGTRKEYHRINKVIEIKGEDGQYCKIIPHDDFCIDITIDFKGIIGKQSFLYSFKQTNYLKEISWARSMLIFEIKDINNPWLDSDKQFDLFPNIFPADPKKSPYIAYTEKKFLTPLKNSFEPVIHKLLDFIGDLIFLGKIPLGKFEIYKPGHAFNRKIVNTIFNLSNPHQLHFEYFLKKIPEIKKLNKYIENNIVHKDENVLAHTKKVFKNAIDILEKYSIDDKKRFRFLLATFLHDYGKKDNLFMENNGKTSCPSHEESSVKCVMEETLLDRFNLNSKDKKWILDFIKNHNEIHNIFVKKNIATKNNLKNFRNKYRENYVENLIFGISDIKDSYFKVFDKKEYDRRIKLIKKELKNLITNLLC